MRGYDAPTIFAEHLAWAKRHAEPLTKLAAPHTNDRTPDRRLKIGYSSAYFRSHAVNFFTEPILLAHDHQAFEIVCYNDARNSDAVTDRLRAAADKWRNVRLLSDERLAEQIRRDEIDILVDLTGHIAHNRLLAFARKPGAGASDLHRLSEYDRHDGDGLSADRRPRRSAGHERRILHREAGAAAALLLLLQTARRIA